MRVWASLPFVMWFVAMFMFHIRLLMRTRHKSDRQGCISTNLATHFVARQRPTQSMDWITFWNWKPGSIVPWKQRQKVIWTVNIFILPGTFLIHWSKFSKSIQFIKNKKCAHKVSTCILFLTKMMLLPTYSVILLCFMCLFIKLVLTVRCPI